jgi:hypothetical protein
MLHALYPGFLASRRMSAAVEKQYVGLNIPLADTDSVGRNASDLVFSASFTSKGIPNPSFSYLHGGGRARSLRGDGLVGLRWLVCAHVGKSDHVPSPGSGFRW